mmetsp:Transcript_12909/g.39022  ORF Transcript_12909/g.39022 Transcript_12909/m.39022 type:complete len:236 (+) Transcript_12909:5534-6241(+)
MVYSTRGGLGCDCAAVITARSELGSMPCSSMATGRALKPCRLMVDSTMWAYVNSSTRMESPLFNSSLHSISKAQLDPVVMPVAVSQGGECCRFWKAAAHCASGAYPSGETQYCCIAATLTGSLISTRVPSTVVKDRFAIGNAAAAGKPPCKPITPGTSANRLTMARRLGGCTPCPISLNRANQSTGAPGAGAGAVRYRFPFVCSVRRSAVRSIVRFPASGSPATAVTRPPSGPGM